MRFSRLAGITVSDRQVSTMKMEEAKNDSTSLTHGGDNAPGKIFRLFVSEGLSQGVLSYFVSCNNVAKILPVMVQNRLKMI